MTITVANRHTNTAPLEKCKYIGRGTPVGNPFPITASCNRNLSLKKFKKWFIGKLLHHDEAVIQFLEELRDGDILLCSCSPEACHGDFIVEIWEEFFRGTCFSLSNPAFRAKYSKYGEYYPKEDGVTHINVYSKGATQLGVFLSNFTYAPIEHPAYGKFASLEGFWYWASSGQQYDQLRELHGHRAKMYGRNLPKVPNGDFQNMIKEMIRLKLETYPLMKQQFKDSELPFTHYYYYGEVLDPKIVERDQDYWIVEYLEQLRTSYKNCRIIIAGSRDIDDYAEVVTAVQRSGFEVKRILSGMAQGVDLLGKRYGEERGIPVDLYPADWETHKRKAGYLRNMEMAKNADGLIAVWDRKSKGTKHMIDIMLKMNKPVFVYIVSKNKIPRFQPKNEHI